MYIKEHCTGANCIVGLPAVQIKCYQSKLDKLHLHSVQKCTEVYMNTVRGSYYRLVGYSLLLSTLGKIDGAIPRSTRKTTMWAVNTWECWRDCRKEENADIPPSLDGIDNNDLNHWLARFVIEGRNQNGEHYTGSILYSLCAGIQRHVREKRMMSKGDAIDIYKDPAHTLEVPLTVC